MLAQAPGTLYVGEIDIFWQRYARALPCACGAPVSQCEFWAPLAAETLAARGAGAEQADVHVTVELLRRAASAAGADVVVDTSKSVAFAEAMLRAVPAADVALVHLVRDARGAVHSRQRSRRRRQERHPRPFLARQRLAFAAFDAVAWVRHNRRLRRLVAGLPAENASAVRYEDVVADPRRLPSLLPAVVAGHFRTVAAGGTADLPATHAVGGNRNRFDAGETVIVEDRSWESGLGRVERRIIEALTRRGA